MNPHESSCVNENKQDLYIKMCRCCLSTERNVTKITLFRGPLLELSEINVSESDGLPEWLCWECAALLRKSVRFKQQVIQAHSLLYEFHRRCAPFTIECPELKKFTSPHLSTTRTLTVDTETSPSNRKSLQHENIVLHILEDESVRHQHRQPRDSDVIVKSEESPSEGEDGGAGREDGRPALGRLDKSGVELQQLEPEVILKEGGKRPANMEMRVKKRETRKGEEQKDSVPVKRNRSLRRKPVKIDETKIRIIKLDPAEQVRQREEERKATSKFPFHCYFCFKGFNFESKLNNHMSKHSPSRGIHKCELCSTYLPSAHRASVHALIHTRRYECVRCGRRMRDRHAIVNHYRSEHEGVLEMLTCHICGKVSNNEKTHRGHMRNTHSSTRVECDECGKTFVNKDSLGLHQLIHQDVKNYECEQCGKRFRTRNQIRHHMYKHSDDRNYYCVECDVRFKSAHILRQHLKKSSKHQDTKSLKFGCDLCDKRFDSERRLTRHVRVQHDGIREHRCEQCGASFALRNSLNRHARVVHAGQRAPLAHVCDTCGKQFRAKRILVNHVRTHTGEKPFECLTCGRRFAQHAAMCTHVKLVHLKIGRKGKIKPKMGPDITRKEGFAGGGPAPALARNTNSASPGATELRSGRPQH